MEGGEQVGVAIKLCKVRDTATGRNRVQKGGMWPVEASCILVDGEERWMSVD